MAHAKSSDPATPPKKNLERAPGVDGILLDIKGKFTMWKRNASRLSSNLVVMLLLLSRVKSRSR